MNKGYKIMYKDFNKQNISDFVDGLITNKRAFAPIVRDLPKINNLSE